MHHDAPCSCRHHLGNTFVPQSKHTRGSSRGCHGQAYHVCFERKGGMLFYAFRCLEHHCHWCWNGAIQCQQGLWDRVHPRCMVTLCSICKGLDPSCAVRETIWRVVSSFVKNHFNEMNESEEETLEAAHGENPMLKPFTAGKSKLTFFI